MSNVNKKIIIIVAIILVVIIALTTVLSVLYIPGKYSPLSDENRIAAMTRFDDSDYYDLPATDEFKRIIDENNPVYLITCYSVDSVMSVWNNVPNDIKPYAILNVIPGNINKPGASTKALIDITNVCDANNIPYSIQSINGETFYEWVLPMSWYQKNYHDKPMFMGLNSAEIYNGEVWRGQIDGDMAWYINDAINFCADMKGYFFWTDTNIFGTNGTIVDWIEENEYLYDTLVKNGKHVIMQNKESYGDPSSYSLMKGLYMAGLIGGWGVATDWWHWQVEGYKVPFKQWKNNIDGEWERIYYYPEAMQAMSMAMVAADGGFAFKNEAEFYSVSVGGKRTASFEYAILPFLRDVVTGNFHIPSRQELLENEQFAVIGGENYEPINYNLKESKLYPDTPSYSIIPLLPSNLRVDQRQNMVDNGIKLITDKLTAKNAIAYTNEANRGDTYLSNIGNSWLYINNLENIKGNKTAETTGLTSDNVERLSITSGNHCYAYFVEKVGMIDFTINNYVLNKKAMMDTLDGDTDPYWTLPQWIGVNDDGSVKADGADNTRETVIKLVNKAHRPSVKFVKDGNAKHKDYTYKEDYNETTGEYELRITHNGYVKFSIETGSTEIKTKQIPHHTNADLVLNDAYNYEELKAYLESKSFIIKERSKYNEISYFHFAKLYSRLQTAITQKNLTTKEIDKCRQDLDKIVMVNIESAVSLLRQVMTDNNNTLAHDPKLGEKFDNLLRSVLSPTEYYNGKDAEGKLRVRIVSKKTNYSASMGKGKIKEINAKISDLQKYIANK